MDESGRDCWLLLHALWRWRAVPGRAAGGWEPLATSVINLKQARAAHEHGVRLPRHLNSCTCKRSGSTRWQPHVGGGVLSLPAPQSGHGGLFVCSSSGCAPPNHACRPLTFSSRAWQPQPSRRNAAPADADQCSRRPCRLPAYWPLSYHLLYSSWSKCLFQSRGRMCPA